MAFKTKAKNRQIIDDRQTLDAKHNNILQAFSDNKDNISDLYNELENVNSIINDLTIQNLKSPILNMLLQQQIWEYDDKKKILEDTIYRIKNNIDETSYMLKTGKLLSNYYKIINEEKNISSTKSIGFEKEPTMVGSGRKRNIIDWFQTNSNDILVDKQTVDNQSVDTLEIDTLEIDTLDNKEINNETTHKQNILNDKLNHKLNDKLNNDKINNEKFNNDKINDTTINNNTKNVLYNKDIIYEKFMKLIDKNYININNENIDIFDTCPKCSIEMLLNNNTGQLICPKCGIIENIIVDSDKPSFKEPPKEMTSFCYKRINHLNEFLAQFQAKETTDIPEDVYNEILMEIKKERITNMAYITPDKMRILLKKIKKNDYYEHIPYIINQLNGLPAPVIAPEIEEIIRGMFKAIQIPFEKYCPNKRKNFLSYNYVMYKFFELLELDEYLNCFQLLKSRTKLHQQDQIWKNICVDLNWEFIKSL